MARYGILSSPHLFKIIFLTPIIGDAGGAFFQLRRFGFLHEVACQESANGGLVVAADVRGIDIRQAHAHVIQAVAEDDVSPVVRLRFELWRVRQGAGECLAAARNVRMRDAVRRLVHVERKGAHRLVDGGDAVGGTGAGAAAAQDAVIQVVHDDEGFAEDVAVVAEERRDLAVGVDGDELGRVFPRQDVVQLQVALAAVQCSDEGEAGVGRGGAEVEFHGGSGFVGWLTAWRHSTGDASFYWMV